MKKKIITCAAVAMLLSVNTIKLEALAGSEEQVKCGIHIISDFETLHWDSGWTAQGPAFGKGPVETMNWDTMGLDTWTLETWNMIAGFEGKRLVHSGLKPSEDYSCHGDCTADHPRCAIPDIIEGQTGTLTSLVFDIKGRFINFKVGGSMSPDKASINLLVNGKLVKSASGANSEYLRAQTWDVTEWLGRKAQIQIIDSDPEGHISVDQITMGDMPSVESQSIFFQSRKVDRIWDTWMMYHDGLFYLYWLTGTQYGLGGRPLQQVGIRQGYSPRMYGVSLAVSENAVRWKETGLVIRKKRDAQWIGSGAVWKRVDFETSGVFVMNFSEWRGPTGDLGQQTIFFAESRDLVHWTRLPDEYEFKPDTSWYFINRANGSRWDCIFPVAKEGGGYYGYLTGTPKPRGKIAMAMAESPDGVKWEALPPVDSPIGGEVGACTRLGNRYYMMAAGGLCMVSDSPMGPFHTQAKNPNPVKPAMTHFPRFADTPFGTLVHCHIYDEPANRLSLLKRTDVDEEGILRLKWFEMNNCLKYEPVSDLHVQQIGSIRYIEGLENLREGIVIEGVIDLASLPFAATAGMFVAYSKDKGIKIQMDSKGVCYFDQADPENGSGLKHIYTINRELTVNGTVPFRLVLQDNRFEFYLDDFYITTTGTDLPVQRIGITGDTGIVSEIKAWKAMTYY
jgi:hypothetical protein